MALLFTGCAYARGMAVDSTSRADLPSEAVAGTVTFDATLPAEFRGQRVDQALAQWLATRPDAPTVSRMELKRWILAGAVRLDGRLVEPDAKVGGEGHVHICAERRRQVGWQAAQQLDFPIVYADESVIIVDKPAGLVVHPGAGNPGGTLVNGLLARWPELANVPRAGLVHRLDKDTTGLLVAATNVAAQLTLAEDMAERRIERRYLAIAEGRLISNQRIDLAIGRDPRNRLRQTVREDGRPAVTHVAVRERYAAHTLVEARLETGRTHQVRVHLAAIGHPLVGDKRYGARGTVHRAASPEHARIVRDFSRQALHAYRLAFSHPKSSESMAFESPLPDDLRRLLSALAGAARTEQTGILL